MLSRCSPPFTISAAIHNKEVTESDPLQNGEQNRLDAAKRQLVEATLRLKDAQNLSEDSEAKWRSCSSLTSACQQSADTSEAYVLAAQRFVDNASSCHAAATAALEAHAQYALARQQTLSGSHEAPANANPSDHGGFKAIMDVHSSQRSPGGTGDASSLVVRCSQALGRHPASEQALRIAHERVEHTETILGHLQCALVCRQDTLRLLHQALSETEEHHDCAERLLQVDSELRAKRRLLNAISDHADEV